MPSIVIHTTHTDTDSSLAHRKVTTTSPQARQKKFRGGVTYLKESRGAGSSLAELGTFSSPVAPSPLCPCERVSLMIDILTKNACKASFVYPGASKCPHWWNLELFQLTFTAFKGAEKFHRTPVTQKQAA